MARTGPSSSGGDFEFPATSGALAGWAALVLCAGSIAGLAVTSRDLVGLRLGLGLALFGLLSWAFLVRPRIRVREGALVLVNPLEEVSIPLELVSRLAVRSATYVYVAEKRYVGVAVGRKVRQMTSGRGVASAGVTPFGLSMGRSLPVADHRPTRDERVPDLLEEWVGSRVKLARLDGSPDGLAVERKPLWWLVVLSGLLLAALAVTLLL